MNVQASESMNEAWTGLQGHVINNAFPLHRYLSGSEHTGVFLAESRRHKLAQVAVKLVRPAPARADAQLSRWLTADGLAHPHLIRIFEAGRCQLGGLQYLYAVMEYADQNLAELLDHRALSEDEAREMLAPTLSALAFLHERKFVQGQLKPSNILVVGDQLKLASDTIRRAGESLDTDKPMTVYDPPESRGGSYWPAGDVWALGVSLCEALTCNRPVGLHDGGRPVAFPRDFPTAFREIVGRCLSRRPHDRPSIADVDAWLRGKQAAAVAPTPASKVAPEASGKTASRDASEAAAKAGALDVPSAASSASAREASADSARDASAAAHSASPRDASASSSASLRDASAVASTSLCDASAVSSSASARDMSGEVSSGSGRDAAASASGVRAGSAAAASASDVSVGGFNGSARATSVSGVGARDSSAAASSSSAHDARDGANNTPPRGAANAGSKAGTIEVSEAALYTPPRDATGGMATAAGTAHTFGTAGAHGTAGTFGTAGAPGTTGTFGTAGTPGTAHTFGTAGTSGTASTFGTTNAPGAAPTNAATSHSTAKSSQPPVMTATATHHAKPPSRRRTLVVTIAAAAALALIWAGARMLRTHQSPLAPPTADIVDDADVTTSAPPQTQIDASLAAPNEPAVPLASSNTHPNSIAHTNGNADPNDTPAEPEPEVSAGAVNEVMPDVPRRARQTIRGHVKVSVRLIVDQDGSVFAALVDDGGPSKYFSRLAIEAAKRWAFAPVDTDGQRLVQVRFDFTRDGTTARAIPLK